MNKLEAIQKRHSVRNYLDRPIEKELVEKLKKEIDQRANRKHFISSYNTMETSLNSTFTIINHIDKQFFYMN